MSKTNHPKGAGCSAQTIQRDPDLPCGTCQTHIEEATPAIECEICTQWFHISCQNINKTKFDFLKKANNHNIHWYCNTCNTTTANIIKSLANMKKQHEQLVEEVKEIKEKLKTENLNETIDNRIKETWASVAATNKTEEKSQTQMPINEIVKEIEDKTSRRANMIIHNLPEAESNLKEDRINHDKHFLQQIIETCEAQIKLDDMTNIIRLGKKRTDNKPRTLKVTLTNENTKRKLFGKLHKLKSGQSPLTEIRVQHDMTPSEREQETKLFKQAKDQQTKAEGKWIFKVRGPPWAREIIKIKAIPEADLTEEDDTGK